MAVSCQYQIFPIAQICLATLPLNPQVCQQTIEMLLAQTEADIKCDKYVYEIATYDLKLTFDNRKIGYCPKT